jgi:hypothetical protein
MGGMPPVATKIRIEEVMSGPMGGRSILPNSSEKLGGQSDWCESGAVESGRFAIIGIVKAIL